MNIKDFLHPDAINLSVKADDKKTVLTELVEPLVKTGKLSDKKKMVKILLDREELGSTGVGQGIAIPHGKAAGVKELVASFGVSQKGIAFEALDGELVTIFVVLLAPEDSAGVHLKALAKVSGMLKDKFIRKALMQAKSANEILGILDSGE